MRLTDRFDDKIIYKGREIKLRMYFDVVLRALELWEDDHFNEAQKVEIFVDMFTENKESIVDLDIMEKSQVAGAIFNHFILEKPLEDGEKAQAEGKKPLYDLTKDAEYIYASFLFDYNMDLFEQHGKLHWRKFNALLACLSEKSKFKEVVSIRGAKIPPPNKYNYEERKRLMELKRIYRLEETESVEELDARLDSVAAMFRPRGGETIGRR